MENQKKNQWISPEEAYIYVGQQKLRRGYTTGSCAAAAAQAAARVLFGEEEPKTVELTVPKGLTLCIPVHSVQKDEGQAQASVCKDSGDDPDVTDHIEVVVSIQPNPTPGITIQGGQGVGKVTKPGLEMPVGEAAINKTPRRMIREQIELVQQEHPEWEGVGLLVTVSIPKGEEIAKKTYNPRLGIEGGISVLGTSGIVEPMSQQAILDTIQLEMNQAALRAGSPRRLILAPGNYGLDYLHERYPEFYAVPVVKTSNFIGDTLDMAAAARFEEVLLVGHVGKLVKVAGGIMNTHSHTADCRTELFCTHAALCGASREVCAALMNAATTDACLELLDSAGLRAPVLESLLRAVQLHLDRRACGAFRVGAVLFSNQHGPLGATDTAAQLLNEWKEH